MGNTTKKKLKIMILEDEEEYYDTFQ